MDIKVLTVYCGVGMTIKGVYEPYETPSMNSTLFVPGLGEIKIITPISDDLLARIKAEATIEMSKRLGMNITNVVRTQECHACDHYKNLEYLICPDCGNGLSKT